MGASAVIVAGTARIPAQLRISEIISECVANVHLVTSRNDEQFPSDNSGISLIVLSVVSGGEIGRSIKGRYDIAVIPLKTFNTDGAEGIINALSNLCKQIILIYGQGRIEALQR